MFCLEMSTVHRNEGEKSIRGPKKSLSFGKKCNSLHHPKSKRAQRGAIYDKKPSNKRLEQN